MSELNLLSELTENDRRIQYSRQLLDRCEELKYTIKDSTFIPKKYNDELIIVCNSGHEFKIMLKHFIKRCNICPMCDTTTQCNPKLTIQDIQAKINKSKQSILVKSTMYMHEYESLLLYCTLCDTNFEKKWNTIRRNILKNKPIHIHK